MASLHKVYDNIARENKKLNDIINSIETSQEIHIYNTVSDLIANNINNTEILNLIPKKE